MEFGTDLRGLITILVVARGDWTLKIADLVGQDLGTLVSWGLELVAGPSSPAMVRRESAPALAIPDQDAPFGEVNVISRSP